MAAKWFNSLDTNSRKRTKKRIKAQKARIEMNLSKDVIDSCIYWKKLKTRRMSWMYLLDFSYTAVSFFSTDMVFCYQNCLDQLWEKIVLVIDFWNSRLKAENLQKFWDHLNNLFKQWKTRTIFANRMLS